LRSPQNSFNSSQYFLSELRKCNDLLESLWQLVQQLEAVGARLAKACQSVCRLCEEGALRPRLVAGVAEAAEVAAVVGALAHDYGRELSLKRLLVGAGVAEARRSHASRVATAAAWLHQPFLSDTLAARFHALARHLLPAKRLAA
jgi:hypothetical protein